jgi:tetratricopeptide (TPR) repeat protein
MAEMTEDRTLSWYARSEPLVVVLLTATAVIFFFAVSALSSAFQRQQEARANGWFNKGNSDLKSGKLQQAVSDFHTALTYSPDNYDYQLSLAQALLALDKTEQAYGYLINLWQRQPENGTVNLELARIFADKGDTNQALRYYHNAIYAVWSDKSGAEQRAVRLELVTFLLRHGENSQAEAELIALSGDLPEDAALRAHVGDLFMDVPDYERALGEYRQSLKLEHRDAAAMAGAGHAAFELGRYGLAEHYLQLAVAANPDDATSRDLLRTAQLVLKMDPYQMQITAAQRDRLVVAAFRAAGDRLKACSAQLQNAAGKQAVATSQTQPQSQATAGSSAPSRNPAQAQATVNSADPNSPSNLYAQWLQLNPRITEHGLQRDPDLIDRAMNLVFSIERQTSDTCGAPTGADLALLLISKLHEAS